MLHAYLQCRLGGLILFFIQRRGELHLLSRASRISSSARPLPFFGVTAILGVAVRGYGIENNISRHRAFFRSPERNVIYAPGYQRITAENPPYAEKKPRYRSPLAHSLIGIRRTGRIKSATWSSFQAGNILSVYINKKQENYFQLRIPIFRVFSSARESQRSYRVW